MLDGGDRLARAMNWGSSKMSAIESTGAIAADCSSNARTTSSLSCSANPRGDRLVELVLMLEPAGVIGEPGLVDELGPSDEPHDALGDRLRAARQPEPAPVAGLVGVARRR